MRAVDLINKLREAEERMEAAQARVTVSKSIAEKTTATLSGERGNGNGHVSAHEDAIIRLMEAEALYEQSALAYNQMVDEIMKLLQCIGDTEKRNVAVAVIINKQRLLVHARNFRGTFNGLVAGFLEPGETLEECVHREVLEETGLHIKNLKYFGSQPWPYPSGIMIGFTADYESGNIKLQQEELSAGAFYTKDNLPEIPKKLSLARKLIDAWLEEKNHL